MQYPADWKVSRSGSVNDIAQYSSIYYNETDIARFGLLHNFSSQVESSDRRYTMIIDVHSIFDEGSEYEVDYIWNSALNEGTWFWHVYELSSTGKSNLLNHDYRIFANKSNDFSTSDNDYFLPFSFDLDRANYPTQYRVNLLAQEAFVLDDLQCDMVDPTGWVPIPPPHFSISASPGSLELRPEEEKDIQLKIQSNTTLNARVFLSAERVRDLNVTLTPNQTTIVPFGVATSVLNVKDISNGNLGSYIIPLNVTISFPQNTTLIGTNVTVTNSKSANVVQNLYLTATLLPPYNAKDYLDNLVAWLSPINSVWTFLAAIGAVIVPLIIRRKQQDQKEKELSDIKDDIEYEYNNENKTSDNILKGANNTRVTKRSPL
jgi:hypothetical protein